MIVASVLLIPVAVLFLALGLINGSSSLLIASIVTSLLVAVALVIGLRQAGATRRPASAQPSGPAVPPSGPAAQPSGPAVPPSGPPARPERRVPEPPAEDSAPAPAAFAGDSVSHDDPGLADQAGARTPPSTVERDEARAAGARDTAAHLGDEQESVPPAAADYAESDSTPQSADYQQASSVIDAARDADEDAQRRRRPAGTAPQTAETADGDEFGEPDDDDPDDEPLPQAVRPADAVLIARLDLEVLVVDGRPRYHMADCPHLVGRLTEPLGANEAVELGFSPCGLCRPVDRLVATVAHR